MIDINQIRSDPDGVARALRKRLTDLDFSELLEWDERRRGHVVEADTLRARRNEVSGRIPRLKQRGEPVQELIEEMREVGQRIKAVECRRAELEGWIRAFLEVLPNVPDADVPGGGKENNRVLRTWGEAPRFDFPAEDHLAIATGLGLIDFERGVKLAGNGFWVYRGAGALLEWALVSHFIARAVAAGYQLMLLPHIVNWECGYISGQFPKFGQDVYRVDAGDGGDGRGQVLIPTSETALSALHRDEILDAAALPLKYCAFTPCYRREAGSYRTHDRGTIRGHQFHKVELFQFTAPEQSPQALEQMVAHAESLVRELGLHHRTSQLAAADCSAAAAKTYDVEVWIPSLGSYEEVSSASNTRDYQARRARTRVRGSPGSTLVHTLNASGLATSRLLPALLEAGQRADRTVAVPEVLQSYTGFAVIGDGS